MTRKLIDWVVLPLVGLGAFLILWATASSMTHNPDTQKADLPSPAQTWEGIKLYILEPFAKRGELDQGILSFTWLSLQLVVRGYSIALLIGAPLGFLLGASRTFAKCFDPITQILRPVSPLAWLPLGYLIFMAAQSRWPE